MTVSVIIPAYNQGVYLEQAINSALEQTLPDLEVIVVDDGSTDDTAEVARRFSDERVRYIYQENRGLSGARNTGIRNSSGEWVTFLDSDDVNLPEKHAILMKLFETQPELGLVVGTCVIIDQNGEQLGKPAAVSLPADTTRLLLWNPMHVGSVMVRRQWLERVGPFDETLRAYEDWDLYLRLARLECRMGWTQTLVAKYRFHTLQMTRERERMTRASFAVLDKVFSDPETPENWLALKDQAYSSAHLRAAIQSYRIQDWAGGASELDRAIALDPELAANNGRLLAQRLSAVADSPKIAEKLEFLEAVYSALPESLDAMRRERRVYLGACAAESGFDALKSGDRQKARRDFLRAIRYQPEWLLNRGVIATLIHNHN